MMKQGEKRKRENSSMEISCGSDFHTLKRSLDLQEETIN